MRHPHMKHGGGPRFRGGPENHPGFGPGGPGFGPGGGMGFGPGGPGGFGPGPRGGRRGRARRGDVRQAILSLLAESSSTGYGLMKTISERTDGMWRTSPGSIYPTLAQLVDEGLIAPVAAAEGAGSGSSTEYALTEAGGTYVTENRDDLDAVWAPVKQEWAEVADLWTAFRKLASATKELSAHGTPEQATQAAAKLDELRREFYRILAD